MTNTLIPPAPRPVTPLTILTQELAHALALLQQSPGNQGVVTAITRAYQLAAGLDGYLEAQVNPESEALAALAGKTRFEPWQDQFQSGATVRPLEQEMLSGHLEGKTLQFLVKLTKAKTILEIGMFTGYSALAMAEALPPDGYLVACEVDSYAAEFARSCFAASEAGDKIEVKLGPALSTLADLANSAQGFDLVFIDADKQEYSAYLDWLLDGNLLNPDGLICVDNTLFQGQVYLEREYRSANGEAIAEFNQKVKQDPRLEQVILPLRDGLTLIRRV